MTVSTPEGAAHVDKQEEYTGDRARNVGKSTGRRTICAFPRLAGKTVNMRMMVADGAPEASNLHQKST